MNRIKHILPFLLFFCTYTYAQKVALKNNLFQDAMASVNLGIEFKTGNRTTLEIPASINAWNFSDDKKFKHFAVQPEWRWWTCAPFTGHFWGLHGHFASYNAGGLKPFKALEDYRYEGWLAGAGISYGYNWILSSRWSVEATLGVGYAYMSYDKFRCGKCESRLKEGTRHYFGPTRLGLSIVFLLK